MRFKNLLLSSFVFLAVSCEKKPQTENKPPLIDKGKGVFITNEGTFGWGYASVSYYRCDSNTIYEDIFNTVNHRHLGDVCQSMYIYNDKAYIIVNNSQKIEIVDVNTFVSAGSITGLRSPRYFLPVSASKAYVSDMYSNTLSVINLNTNTKTGDIVFPGSSEEMVLANNKVYITNTLKPYLFIADPATDQITDSIHLSYGTLSVKQDNNGKLWVMCMGNANDHTPAALYKINPVNKAIETSIGFSSPLNAWNKLKMNKTHDTLYFTNNGVFRMKSTDSQLPSDTFIKSNGRNFYGLGISPFDGNIYISDALDYVQKGKVYIYSNNGILLRNFNAGIIPGDFIFY